MWQEFKQMWRTYPVLFTIAMFLIVTAAGVSRLGVECAIFTLSLMVGAIGLVMHVHGRRLADRELFNERLQCIQDSSQAFLGYERGRSVYWFDKYISQRTDRVAFLKVLATVFPSGFREEHYIVESPMRFVDYGLDHALQWFLYIDLPEDSGTEIRQLRFAVSATEKDMIGDLPLYTAPRTTLLETDSQLALRQYLFNTSFEHLKESSDESAVGV